MTQPKDKYTCASCGGTFLSDRSDVEARAEFNEEFPGETELEVVCHDCYTQIMAWWRRGLNTRERPS